MLFNSIEFGVFLPIVFAIYWFVTHVLNKRNDKEKKTFIK